MSATHDFAAKIAVIRQAMEREDWAGAIGAADAIGVVPEKFTPIVANIIFYLDISRNRYAKLLAASASFTPAKPKDAVCALLLFRDHALGYPVVLPAAWELDVWEKAIGEHARAGRLEPKELSLCLHFLSVLNRPQWLGLLHRLAVAAGAGLGNELIEVVLRCYLRHAMHGPARRFLWQHNLNDIDFERFSFLIDRSQHMATDIPEADDKFLRFLRRKFGTAMPVQLSAAA